MQNFLTQPIGIDMSSCPLYTSFDFVEIFSMESAESWIQAWYPVDIETGEIKLDFVPLEAVSPPAESEQSRNLTDCLV
jgi:hypothetical protein